MKRHSIRDWGNLSQNHNEHCVAPNKTELELKNNNNNKQKITVVDEDVEDVESLCTADESIK